jgi:hypothetical protein
LGTEFPMGVLEISSTRLRCELYIVNVIHATKFYVLLIFVMICFIKCILDSIFICLIKTVYSYGVHMIYVCVCVCVCVYTIKSSSPSFIFILPE